MNVNIPRIKDEINHFLHTVKGDPLWKKINYGGESIFNVSVFSMDDRKTLEFEHFLRSAIIEANRDLSDDHTFIMSISGCDSPCVQLSICKDGALGIIITLSKLVEIIGINGFYGTPHIQLRNNRQTSINHSGLRQYAEDLYMKRVHLVLGKGLDETTYRETFKQMIEG